MIREVTESDLEPVRAFLEAHLDSSLFLLSNLAMFGPHAGPHPNSGRYRLVEEEGRIAAVFCLTRRGNLLTQAAGRADLAEDIMAACDSEPFEVNGVAADWPTAQALWNLLCADPAFEPSLSVKDMLYSRPLSEEPHQAPGDTAGVSVRTLGPDDFLQWESLNGNYLAEMNIPQTTLQQRREDFETLTRARRWWGAFEGEQLVSIAGLNAVYARLAQVGGVHTRPEHRRRGYSRRVMQTLLDDCRREDRFDRLVLFTAEDNAGARRLYESLGFGPGGAFGLFLGTRHPHARTQLRYPWTGQSGEIYTYEIYEWPTRLSPGPGNFIFTCGSSGRSSSVGNWRPLLIGETADLSELTVHEQLRMGRHALTHVHIRANFNPVAVRRREVADLDAKWTPSGHESLD